MVLDASTGALGAVRRGILSARCKHRFRLAYGRVNTRDFSLSAGDVLATEWTQCFLLISAVERLYQNLLGQFGNYRDETIV